MYKRIPVSKLTGSEQFTHTNKTFSVLEFWQYGFSSLSKKHLVKMKEIMKSQGSNFKLIRLYTSKGAGDIAMLAFALAENSAPETLFAEPYTLVTKDNELKRVAVSYRIPCLETI